MRWKDRRESTNIEDRRGMSGGGKLALGGLGGCGTIVVLLLALLFGADPRQLLEQLPATGGGALRRRRDRRILRKRNSGNSSGSF